MAKRYKRIIIGGGRGIREDNDRRRSGWQRDK